MLQHMKRLGAYEAKTHLARVLDEVERGETFAITKHGRVVAVLAPAAGQGREMAVERAISGLQEFGERHSLAGISVRDLIDDGRRR